MNFIIDPRRAAKEVTFPVVVWQGNETQGNESWQGELTEDASVAQVELRRTLANDASVVVRLNIGNLSTNSKGVETAAGVVISSNKAIVLSWRGWYELLNAVDEGIERLITLQKDMYARLGEKLSGGDRHDFGREPEGE